jgi:hypothetical protein
MTRPARLLFLVTVLGVLAAGPAAGLAQTDQASSLEGVPFRIQIPRDWNHGLVVYTHGMRTWQALSPSTT